MKLLSSRTFLITGGLLRSIRGQSSAFTRQKGCPNDSSLVGYTNLPDLNDDMAAELQRVSKGGTPPDGGYNLVMCPGETFDTSGGNAIRPVINQVRIACGGPASVDPVCLITGNQEQLVIENPSISRYAIKSVTIEGLMFSNFTKRASAALTASSPTIFTCIACIWQDFNGSDFAINLQGTMTARLENSVVRGTSGNTARAVINEAIFNIGKGILQVEGLLVEDVTTRKDVIRITSGSVNVSDSLVSRSIIPGNVVHVEGGASAVLSNVSVAKNSELNVSCVVHTNQNLRFFTAVNRAKTVFFARGQGSSMQIVNSRISENRLTSAWSGVTAAQGSSVFLQGSLFQNNEGLMFGVSSEGQPGAVSTIDIEQTRFVNNIAFNTSDTGPKAVVATIGTDAADPIMNVTRVDFEGNSGFTANIMTLLGGQITANQACFTRNTNTLVAFQSKDGEPISFSNSFIANDERPEGCGASGLELGVESSGSSGCFYPGSTDCRVTCQGPVADSPICLSQVALTEAPSAAPSGVPTNTQLTKPSDVPSMEPSADPLLAPTKSPARPSDIPNIKPNGYPLPQPSATPTPTQSPGPFMSGIMGDTPIPTPFLVDMEIPGSPFNMFPTMIVPSIHAGCSGKAKVNGTSRWRPSCYEKRSSKKESKRQKGNRVRVGPKPNSKLKKSSKAQEDKGIKGSKTSGRSGKSRKRGKGAGLPQYNDGAMLGGTTATRGDNTVAARTNGKVIGEIHGEYRTYQFDIDDP